jgi:hypothetical protein
MLHVNIFDRDTHAHLGLVYLAGCPRHGEYIWHNARELEVVKVRWNTDGGPVSVLVVPK